MDEEKIRRFLDSVFGPEDTNPCVVRNQGCGFTDAVIDYLYYEWGLDLVCKSRKKQSIAMDIIDDMKGRGNVPNTAVKIFQALR